MDYTNFVIFFAASWALIITPGPDIFYVITQGVAHGKKAGILSAVGVTLGILVHTLFAALGLAIILQTSAIAFLIVKFAGAGYLIYLGIKSIIDRSQLLLNNRKPPGTSKKIFIQGIMTNVLNPKVALFFLAFLPQFVNPTQGNVQFQMACLGGFFALFGLIFLLILGYFSGNIGTWISSKDDLAKKIKWVTGSILIGLGLRLAFTGNKP